MAEEEQEQRQPQPYVSFSSKKTAECYYCGESMRSDKLKRLILYRHPGQSPKTRGD